MQRVAPYDEHEERMGLTGIPDCTFYSHAAAATTTTGFVVKFNDNGDETQRGNKNSKFQKSITGYVKTTEGTYATSIAPCQGNGDLTTHVLTGASTCASSPRGCSCLVLDTARSGTGETVFSKTSLGVPLTGTATTDVLTAAFASGTGMRIRITSGKAAGYEGIISAFKFASGAFYTIPALPEMPDEHSQFTLQPWNNLQPNIHMASCATSNILTGTAISGGMGCAAYGVEWAKTIGWSIAQTKVTPNNPINMEGGVYGTWMVAGTTPSTATELYLNTQDEVVSTTFYNGYWVELSTQTAAQVKEHGSKAMALARVTAYIVSTAATDGGKMTIECPDITAGCPVATRYRLIAKSTTNTGIAELESKATYQQSMPQSVSIMDSDVYIGGWFKGFDRFRFGIEGVDETIGYKSINVGTWETYLVKLSD